MSSVSPSYSAKTWVRHLVMMFLLALMMVTVNTSFAASPKPTPPACSGACNASESPPNGANAYCTATYSSDYACTCMGVLGWRCEDANGVYSWAKSFLRNFLSPFYTLIIATTRIIGIFLIFWGLMRLRRMGHHSMMHRLSPISTTMFFVVGAIFAGFMPEIMIFSGAIFNGLPDLGSGYSGANYHLMTTCASAIPGHVSTAPGIEAHSYCPIMGYYNELNNNQGSSFSVSPEQTVLQVIYALLLVVGVISFLRGCLFLLRLGEGNTQDGSMPKAVTHIIAGIIGINAHDFQLLMGSLLPHNVFT